MFKVWRSQHLESLQRGMMVCLWLQIGQDLGSSHMLSVTRYEVDNWECTAEEVYVKKIRDSTWDLVIRVWGPGTGHMPVTINTDGEVGISVS